MKKLLALIVSIALVCSSAYAAALNVSHDDVNNKLTISGSIDSYDYANTLTLSVLKVGKSYEQMQDSTTETLSDALAIFDIIMTESDGSYSATYDVKKLFGDYTVVLTLDDETYESVDIMIASRKEKETFVEEVIAMAEAAASASALNAKLDLENEKSPNAKLFGIAKDSDIFAVDSLGLSSVLKKTLEDKIAEAKEDEIEFTLTPEEFVEVLEFSAKIQLVNEGKLNPAKDDETALFFGLDSKYLATYKSKVSQSDKESYQDFFKGSKCLTIEDVADAFNTTVVNYILSEAETWKDYKDIIVDYGEDIGIDMDDYEDLKKKDDISSYLDNSYSKVSTFVDDVNDAIEDLLDGTSKKDNGGGFAPVKGTETQKYPLDMDDITSADNAAGFTDLSGYDWAKDAILSLSAKGIVNGTGDGKFDPANNVTREQFVKMIVLAMNVPLDASVTAFTDVELGSWYSGFISSAFKNGIVNGVSENTFGVGENITREQVAVMLYRAASLNKAEAESTFTDSANISDYAKEAVDALSSLGVINGIDGAFKPKATASRAEAAVMIYRLLGILNK